MGNPENGQLSPEISTEKSELNLAECRERLFDGSADEYLAVVEEFPAEGLLEAVGDERLWPDLSEEEQESIKALLVEYAEKNNCRVEYDETRCVIVPN